MDLKKPINENYAAIVTTVKNIVPIANCDNVVHGVVYGQLVIVSKNTKIGDKVVFFPPETKVMHAFLSANNEYRHKELNADPTKGGFFEDNGRVRCVKFRGNVSQGYAPPLSTLSFTGVNIDEIPLDTPFDVLNGIKICEKYIVKLVNPPSRPKKQLTRKERMRLKLLKKLGLDDESKNRLIDGQFRLHYDTNQLYRNLHVFAPDTVIAITRKLHGTSGISGCVLVKRKLNLVERVLKRLGAKIYDREWDYIYSSRKVVRNGRFDSKYKAGEKGRETPNGYIPSQDIRYKVNEYLKPYIAKGMTLYYEIVGYDREKLIQKGYDYGCHTGEHDVYIYRITVTTENGDAYDLSHRQVQDFCRLNNLKAVPEIYYGKLADYISDESYTGNDSGDYLLLTLDKTFNGRNEEMCKNKVPMEGVVVRIDTNNISNKTFKWKTQGFMDYERKAIDNNEVSIEDEDNFSSAEQEEN